MHTLRWFALSIGLTGGLVTGALAQKTTTLTNEMRLKVVEKNGSEVREIERTYRTDGMTDAKRDAIVNKLVDSLRATRKGKNSQISVTVEDEHGTDRIRFNTTPADRQPNGRVYALPGTPRVRRPLREFNLEGNLTFDDDSLGRQTRHFRFDRRQVDSLSREMGRMAEKLQRDLAPMTERLEREFAPLADRLSRGQVMPRRLDGQLAVPFESWSRGSSVQSSTIRGLDAYPNNPDKQLLNVRFTAPGQGNVLIAVTNTKGKEVAQRELKNFTGDFVGQIDLGRKAEGVYFITVTQNEDGAVRRVVLKKDEPTTR